MKLTGRVGTTPEVPTAVMKEQDQYSDIKDKKKEGVRRAYQNGG